MSSCTISWNLKRSQLYQKKSKKLMKLAKKNERLNSIDKACLYYTQSLHVLSMAVRYGVASQDTEIQDMIRGHFKIIQRFMTQLSIPGPYNGWKEILTDEQTASQIPSEEYFLANLDKHVSELKKPLDRVEPKSDTGTNV